MAGKIQIMQITLGEADNKLHIHPNKMQTMCSISLASSRSDVILNTEIECFNCTLNFTNVARFVMALLWHSLGKCLNYCRI